MTPGLLYTIFRLGLLALLWIMVLAVTRTVRADVFGTVIRDKSSARGSRGHRERGLRRGARRRSGASASAAGAAGAAAAGAVSSTGAASSTGFDIFGSGPASASTPNAPRSPSPATAASSAWRLVVTSGPLAGTAVPLTAAGLTIGRSQSCSLVLDDGYVSSYHAKLFAQDGTWMIEDMDSTNGTFVNGARVHGVQPIEQHSVISIGQSNIEVR